MKKIDPLKLNSFCRDERDLLYWAHEQYIRSFRSNKRIKEQINTILDIIKIKYNMGATGPWNGQSKAEYQKNYKAVSDIVSKSDGDEEKQIKLAKIQTAKITDEFKALNRAMVAKEMGHENIFEVFFQRAYELGSVSKQEYREYKLEKIGL